jgi:hypothetical protein
MMTTRMLLTLVVALFAISACSDPPQDPESNGGLPPSAGPDGELEVPDASEAETTMEPDYPVTFHRDILPLLDKHCNDCHVPGSTAGFSMDRYELVAPISRLIAGVVEAGTMPPWLPSADCQEFKHARHLSPEEIAAFRQWADDGAPEGNPADAPPPVTRERMEMGEPDFVIDMGFAYKPTPARAGGVDDYRCFVVDPGLEEDRYVNGFVTHPGNSAVVHHVLVYSVPETAADRLAQLEAEDDRPGYTCFGGPKIGSARLISGWVPGMLPLQFEDKHGIKIPAGSKLVVQMHYNTVYDKEGTDRTTIDLHYVDPADAPLELAIVPLLNSRFLIPAGDDDVSVVATSDPIPLQVTLHGIVPHMHLLGKSIDVKYVRDRTGDEMCLIDIPEWDFNWQGFFLYERPLTLPAGYRPVLTCRYDNSPANQPDGRQPSDVTWGDGTYDEMCLVYFILRLPPGINL